ncbi:MAG: hypothetical protein OEM07_06865 [Gammaproteobacteria bacterium]|nr:hypothetical protein [Gammaproteobacteria bacterium]
MNDNIRSVLKKIDELEQELGTLLLKQKADAAYKINGKRIEFERAVMEVHRKYKTGLLRWLISSRPQNVLSVPFIYGVIPVWCLLDLSLGLYQAVCFRLYGIPLVSRSSYIVIDRHKLAYLNVIEKFNCVYCGYVSGLLAYAREIASSTEQYWCPIKHAHKVLDAHDKYIYFSEYGDASAYQNNLAQARRNIRFKKTDE